MMSIKKKMHRVIIVSCCVIFFLSLTAAVYANPASQALVDEGRNLLLNEGDFTWPGILASNVKFADAVTADPLDEEANFFYAVTRVLVFWLEQNNGPAFDSLATLGDLFGAFGMLRNDAEYVEDDAFTDTPEQYDDYDPPETIPGGEEIRTFLAGPFVSLLDSTISNLNAVGNTFETVLFAWETGEIDIDADYGDVLLFKSVLNTLKAYALIISAYDLSVPDTDVRNLITLDNADLYQLQRDLLDKYNDLFKLRPDGGSTSLDNAKQALLQGIDLYRDAITFVVNETDFQEDDLFYFEDASSMNKASHLLTLLTELQDSLDENRTGAFTTTEQKWILTDVPSGNRLFLEVEKDPDSNIVDEDVWGMDGCDFLFCDGWVEAFTISGSEITIVLGHEEWCNNGDYTYTTTLTGTLNAEGDQITSGTYNGTSCSGPRSGTFTGLRTCEETDTEHIDFNYLFGNSGKAQLGIRGVLPQFDPYDNIIPGTFPPIDDASPVLNNLFPDYPTNEDLTREMELEPSGYFSIPTATTISIDGSAGDWPAGALVFADVSGDGDPDRIGTDIANVYLAIDDTGAEPFLCVAFSLHDGDPDTDVNTNYTFSLRNKDKEDAGVFEIKAYYNAGWWVEAGTGVIPPIATYDPASGYAAAGTNFIEWKLPLADIEGVIGSLNGKFVSVEIDTTPLNPGCDLREHEEENNTRIKLNATAGINGTVTCTPYTSGNLFIKVYDGPSPRADLELGGTYITAPGTYTITGLPDGAQVYVVAQWDVDGNGTTTFGDYQGISGPHTLIAGEAITVDVDIDTLIENTSAIMTIPDKYKLYGSNTYTFDSIYGSDPNGIEWGTGWTFIGEGDEVTNQFNTGAGGYYKTILMIWHKDSSFFFDAFEDTTAGTAFGIDEGEYTWVTRGLRNSDYSDWGEPYYFKGYWDGLYTVTQEDYGFSLFTMPGDAEDPSTPRDLEVTVGKDTDDDGLMDHVEASLGTDPNAEDSDGDRMPDGWEVDYGLFPLIDEADFDMDGDGVSNLEEYQMESSPDSYDSFYVEGSVMNVHNSDGSFSTYIEACTEDDRPEDIKSITVETPGGYIPYVKHDYHNYSQWPECFFIELPGSPELGEYTFTVRAEPWWLEEEDIMGKGRDMQHVIRSIPIPDTGTFSPANGATLTSKTPIFSWAPVDYSETTLYYRLTINDMDGNRVFATSRQEGLFSCAVPVDRLTPGQTYQWRVRVTDSSDYSEVQNRSQSAWLTFTMTGALAGGTAQPAMDTDQWGAVIFSTAVGHSLDLWVDVIDHDGVSYDGSSHDVTVTLPDEDPIPMNFDNSESATVGGYSHWIDIDSAPTPGDYPITFSITDVDGNTATIVDTLTVNTLAPPDENSFTPSNNNPVQEQIAASFDNVYVNGELYDDFNVASILDLDDNKWQDIDTEDAYIQDQMLKVGRNNCTGYCESRIKFKNSAAASTIEADVTIDSISSDVPAAWIHGTFYNNGENDVLATLVVQESVVFYLVRELVFLEGVVTLNTLAREDIMAVTPGTTVTAEISWDNVLEELNFTANGTTKTYTPAGTIEPVKDYYNIGKSIGVSIRLSTPDTTPTFTWNPVTNTNHYRVRIYDSFNDETVWRGYPGNQTSYTLPPGVLLPNTRYFYRIDARDAHTPLDIDNNSKTPASNSDNIQFWTGDEPIDPFIEFDSVGVETWNNASDGEHLSFWTKVHDAQGVPENIESVTVTFPGGSPVETLDYDAAENTTATSGIYKSSSFQPIEAGTYTFTVTDKDGHTFETTEELTPDPIGFPAETSLDAVVNDTAVNFSWNEVTGAAFYRVEIYDSAYNRIYTFATTSCQDSICEYSLPAGFLRKNRDYHYRITTRREFFSQNVDNGSSSLFSTFSTTTGSGPGNDPPTANNGTLTTDEDTPVNGVLSAIDPDGDPLTYSIVSNGSKGTATITNADTGAYTYTPNPNANGSDTFSFKVNDGQVDSNTATVTVTINAVNDPPETPVAAYPAQNQTLPSGNITLQSSSFSDVDTYDPENDNIQIHWQVRRIDQIGYTIQVTDTVTIADAQNNPVQHTFDEFEEGMKYAWRVGYADPEGVTSWSQEYTFRVGTSVADSTVLIEPGYKLESFRMVSFAQWPDDPLAESALADLIVGNYDYNYRIGTYDPIAGGYINYGEGLIIEPGRGYWMVAREGLNPVINGVPVSTTLPIYVSLAYAATPNGGWNMIGCPNARNYLWGNLEVIEYDANGDILASTAISSLSNPNDTIDVGLWRWENGSYLSNTAVMEAYQGYWVKVKKPNIYLKFPVAAQTTLTNDDVVPPAGVAVLDTQDLPPWPMGVAGQSDTNEEGSGGCFVDTLTLE